MSKKSRFRACLDKQYGKRAQALLQYASQHLYLIHWYLARKLCLEKFLLLTWHILGPLFNTFAGDEKYLVLQRDNLTIPIQMQLSEKKITFSQFIAAFLKFRLSFEHFEKKNTLRAFLFPKVRTLETWLNNV